MGLKESDTIERLSLQYVTLLLKDQFVYLIFCIIFHFITFLKLHMNPFPPNQYLGCLQYAYNVLCLCMYYMCVSCSVMSDFLKPHGLQLVRLLCTWDSLGKDTGMGCYSLPQEIFPTQGMNPGLTYCRQILYHLSHKGSHHIVFMMK